MTRQKYNLEHFYNLRKQPTFEQLIYEIHNQDPFF